MGLLLNNTRVRPHLMRVHHNANPAGFWTCAMAVLNPFYGRDPDAQRFLLVQPPVGLGPDAPSAYAEWVRKQPAI